MAEKKRVNTVRLQNLSYGHKQSAALRAAVELGLFTCISQGATRIPDIANAAGISVLNAERLVVASYTWAGRERRRSDRNTPQM